MTMTMERPVASERLLLRIGEAAALVSISRSRLYEMIARGDGPPAVKVGASLRIRRADLEGWVAGLGEGEAGDA